MIDHLNTPLGRLRLVAIIEGITYLLFALTMPMKYLLDIPEPNYVVGLAHGVFFIIYIYLCVINIVLHKWDKKISVLILLASLIPGATFAADVKIFKPEEAKQKVS